MGKSSMQCDPQTATTKAFREQKNDYRRWPIEDVMSSTNPPSSVSVNLIYMLIRLSSQNRVFLSWHLRFLGLTSRHLPLSSCTLIGAVTRSKGCGRIGLDDKNDIESGVEDIVYWFATAFCTKRSLLCLWTDAWFVISPCPWLTMLSFPQ